MKKIFLFIGLILIAIMCVSCTEGEMGGQIQGMEITSLGNIHTIKVGEDLQLEAQVYPTTLTQLFEWSSSDEEVATVDDTGLVSAVGGGKVEIIASYKSLPDLKQKYLLIVEEEIVEIVPDAINVSAQNDKTTCKVGETIKLNAIVNPEGASQKVTWVSSDTTIATVTRGIVRPLQEGQVEISVYPNGYENIVAKITLTFEKADDPIYSNNWPELEYATHEEYMNATDETPLKIKGVVTHINPISKDKVSYFVQNGQEGFYIYSQDNTTMPVVLGKSYEIGGYKKTYRGLAELMDVEYFKELDESLDYEISNIAGLDVSKQEVMGQYQCSFVTGTAQLISATVSSKAYNFTATVNGVTATFRVDPTYASSEQFDEIGSLLQIVAPGAEFTFTGLITAYGTGEIIPQILIVNSSDLNFGEISDEEILAAASSKLDITKVVGFSINEIELPVSIEGFSDVEISWSSDSELINVETGVVTHGTTDIDVRVVATISLNNSKIEKEFYVTVEAQDEKEYEVLASLDLEDALEPNSWGNSESKPSYASGTVELGTPKHKWLLQNALIAAATNDKYNGTLSIRAKATDSAASTGRIEIKESGEYNVIEFAACIYGNDAVGAKVRVEYTLDDGTTWVHSDNVITLNNKVLEVFRVKLPEGVKRVAIVVVENSGNRVNFDDIKLMK